MLRSPFVFAVAVMVASVLRAAEYRPSPGTFTVATLSAVWRDPSRSRDVPVKIYYPAGPGAPAASPVIVFSHGLGGSRDMYAYLGEAWAAHGYVSVHPQHHGSDSELFTESKRPLKILSAVKHAMSNPENLVDRPRDIGFVLDQLALLNGDAKSPLRGRLDLKHLAVAGHSFGAYTVMAIAGQAVGPAKSARYFGPDPRIVAAIAMSSQPAAPDNLGHAYDKITIPIFHMTGTHDESIGARREDVDDGGIGHTSAAGRRVAFDHTLHAETYLLTFAGGDHMVFSGRESGEGGRDRMRKFLGTSGNDQLDASTRASMHQQVINASLAFWDATLRGDPAAKEWLDGGGFAKALGNLGKFEQKHPAH